MKIDMEPLFMCVLCNCKCESKINLKNHMSKHVNLKNHMSKHVNLKNHMSKHVNLKNHMSKHAKTEKIDLSYNDIPSQKYLCVLCNRKYSYTRGIDNHMWNHQEEKITSIRKPKLRFSTVKAMVLSGKRFESDKPFQCHVCGQGFKTKSKMQRHNLIHDLQDLYSCDLCEYSTNRSDSMSNHRLTHFTEKNYMCNKCHKMFKTLRSLKSHILHHEGTICLVCPICSAETMSPGRYKTHLHSHKKDTPEKILTEPLLKVKDMCQQIISENLFCYQQEMKQEPRQPRRYTKRQKTIFLCNICGYMSNKKFNYIVHSLIHSPEKPFKCDYCVYSSKSPSNLSKHRVQCHLPKH